MSAGVIGTVGARHDGRIAPVTDGFGPGAFAAETGVSRETLNLLTRYADLLVRWQPRINLVGARTIPDLWRRHMLDSAQLVPLAPQTATVWLDLGSGAGFPGLVVAILIRERRGALVHLVESNARKCAFLREVIRTTGAPARVHHARAEDLARNGSIPGADVITARALAPLADLLNLAAPFAGENTLLLFLKGQDVDNELTAATKYWNIDAERVPSRSDPDGSVLIVRGLQRVKSTGQ